MAWITRKVFSGDGVTTDFSIADLPYLAESDIKVYLDGSDTPESTANYSFPSASTVRITTPPTSGTHNVTIRRETDKTIISSIAYGATPSTAEINAILTRVQYIAQEAIDAADENLINQLGTDQWDAQSEQIANVADGTESDHAATKGQMDTALAGKQPLDATLTALAGLANGADLLPYFTGTDALGATALTTFARTFLDDVDAATARGTLGLEIGTDVQAFNAKLAALAGVTGAADKFPYFTGATAMDVATVTSFIRTLLDDPDAATARSTLGVGAGTGDVVGPGSTTQHSIALWDSGTKTLKDGPSLGTSGQLLTSTGASSEPNFASLGTSQFPAGTVLQTLSTDKTDTFTTSSGTMVDITGLSVTITPRDVNSKILVIVDINFANDTATLPWFNVLRGSTPLRIGDTAGSRTRHTMAGYTSGSATMQTVSAMFLDSPATTSATTYKVQMRAQNGVSNVHINRTNPDTNNSSHNRTGSSITVIEVAG